MTFDFEKYRAKEQGETIGQTEAAADSPPKEQKPHFDFEKYRSETEEQVSEAGRLIARTGARVAEAVVGTPGNIVQGIKYLSSIMPQTPEFLNRQPNILGEYGKKALEALPTSQELAQFSSAITSGFTDPKSAAEELGDDITSLATILINPSKLTSWPGALKNIGGAIVKATGAKAARKLTKELGGGEGAQTLAEVGSLAVMGMYGQKTAKAAVKEGFERAAAKIPPGTMVDTSRFAKELSNIRDDLAKGIKTATKNKAMDVAEELYGKASGGAMPMEDILQSYRDINEIYSSKQLFGELSKSEQKLLKLRLDKSKDALSKVIKEYGKDNPKFIYEWEQANRAHSILAQTDSIRGFMAKHAKSLPGHIAIGVAAKHLLGLPFAGSVAAGAATAMTARTLQKTIQSPLLRQHYLNTIRAAATENIPAFTKNIADLNKELEKENGATR